MKFFPKDTDVHHLIGLQRIKERKQMKKKFGPLFKVWQMANTFHITDIKNGNMDAKFEDAWERALEFSFPRGAFFSRPTPS